MDRNSPTYAAWRDVRSDSKTCLRWRNFKLFLADMGEAPAGTVLSRLDKEKGYAPGNCQWSKAPPTMPLAPPKPEAAAPIEPTIPEDAETKKTKKKTSKKKKKSD